MGYRQFRRSAVKWGCVICCVLAGCTIIKDTDITGQNQISTLKLRTIQFAQDTNAGSQSVDASVTLDDKGRVGTLSVPTISPYLLKFRSQLPGPVTMEIGYDSITGKLGGVFVRATSSQDYSEIYRFRYDNSGRLQKIITNIYIGADTLHTKDSLMYTNGKLDTIRRSAFDPAKRGDIIVSINATNNGVDNVDYLSQTYSITLGNCSNELSWAECGGYLTPTSASNANFDYNFSTINSLLDQVRLMDNRIQPNGGGGGNCQGCGRQYDTYYFHPLMLFPNQFELGKQLLLIYQIDWWVIGAPPTGNTSVSYTKNDMVSFKFNYGL